MSGDEQLEFDELKFCQFQTDYTDLRNFVMDVQFEPDAETGRNMAICALALGVALAGNEISEELIKDVEAEVRKALKHGC